MPNNADILQQPIMLPSFDQKAKLRQMTSSILERWKTCFYVYDGFRDDQRVQMDGGSRVYLGQRIKCLLVEILKHIAPTD